MRYNRMVHYGVRHPDLWWLPALKKWGGSKDLPKGAGTLCSERPVDTFRKALRVLGNMPVGAEIIREVRESKSGKWFLDAIMTKEKP